MSGHRGRCVIGLLVVLTLVGAAQLHFLLLQMTSGIQPCSQLPGIAMTRHPTNCSLYLLCVGGQAVRMPPCPHGKVWSTSAVRCVPFGSRFNDCPHVHEFSDSKANRTPLDEQINEKTPDHSIEPYKLQPLITQRKALPKLVMDKIEKYFPGHPCTFGTTHKVLPYPHACHWFYNCSLSPLDRRWTLTEPLTEECPYPKLFSLTTRTCLHYTHVDCGERPELKTPCDYRANSCTQLHCRDCSTRLAGCEGLSDGIHPFPGREWTPWFITCKDERTMEQGTCDQDRPIFSASLRACVTSEWVPKQFGGSQSMCFGRPDGFHPNEEGLCSRFFHCYKGEFINAYECEKGRIFNADTWTCSYKSTIPPCGNQILPYQLRRFCDGLVDGYYADPYGRCSLYIHCKRDSLLAYLKCQNGMFDPRSKTCGSALNLPAPCGFKPNICLSRQDGVYPDTDAKCVSRVTCRSGYVSSIDECLDGKVLDHSTKTCRIAELTPPPCGIAPSCQSKADGSYPARLKGCQHFYTCQHGEFRSYATCHIYRGGYLFNPSTGKCDFPHNICPPCGTRPNCSVFNIEKWNWGSPDWRQEVCPFIGCMIFEALL